MENDNLNMLARIVLPAQILDYFLISGVEQTSQEIYISLDEKMNLELSKDVHFESKGFMEAVNVTDFPIRDHKVYQLTSMWWPKEPDTPKNLELF